MVLWRQKLRPSHGVNALSTPVNVRSDFLTLGPGSGCIAVDDLADFAELRHRLVCRVEQDAWFVWDLGEVLL